MEKIARKFATFEEANAADRAYYRSLTPAERIEIMLDLIYREGGDETSARLERVYRIIKFGER